MYNRKNIRLLRIIFIFFHIVFLSHDLIIILNSIY